jgi:hypothetical protein
MHANEVVFMHRWLTRLLVCPSGQRCPGARRIPGGTGHRPVLSGDPPDNRAHKAAREFRSLRVRAARRQVAAGNGRVGRSTRIKIALRS